MRAKEGNLMKFIQIQSFRPSLLMSGKRFFFPKALPKGSRFHSGGIGVESCWATCCVERLQAFVVAREFRAMDWFPQRVFAVCRCAVFLAGAMNLQYCGCGVHMCTPFDTISVINMIGIGM